MENINREVHQVIAFSSSKQDEFCIFKTLHEQVLLFNK